MRIISNKTAGIVGYIIVLFSVSALAGSEPPVKIIFDDDAKRVDIKSGKKLPAYTEAERGSLQFFRGRLDEPEKGFGYMFDGRGFQNFEYLALIRKMPALGAWAIVGGGAWRRSRETRIITNPLNICEIEHHAVSFIPLNLKTGKPDERVYLLLDDIYMIQWKEVDHWVASKSQKEFEDAIGKMY